MNHPVSGGRSPSLSPMLEARSVAVVGASPIVGSVGQQLLRQLLAGGFEGSVHPVNPRYDKLDGLACLSTIAEAGRVDLAVIAVANERLEAQVSAALAAGARSLALFGSCHGVVADGSPLIARLGAMAREAEVPVCGGNGMGFLNIERRIRVCGFFQPWTLTAGGVTFLTHSGSLFSAMLHNHRRIDFNFVVSTGNELATTMDEYLSYAAGLESTSVIGLFLETIRRPDEMARSLAMAEAAGIPVVGLKVGRTERSRASVATHSSALAGDYAGFEAFAAAHGVHVVDTMDELADALQLFAAGRPAAPGGLGAVHDSGGERSLLIDTAARVGVRLASISTDTKERIAEVLEPGLEADNPVDAWGTGRGAEDVVRTAMGALAADPDVGALVLAVDLTAEEHPESSWSGLAIELASSTAKPFAVLANLAGGIDSAEADALAGAGVPVLRGTATGLRAVGHLFAHRDRRPVAAFEPPPPSDLDRWRGRLERSGSLSDLESLELMVSFGIDVVATTVVDTVDDAVDAARRTGYPVVLKTAEGIAHKTEVGGVITRVGDDDGARGAYGELSGIGPRVAVQATAPHGVEMAVGFTRDEVFGPVLMVAAGGVLVELIDDRCVALAPVSPVGARSMLDRLAIRRLLDGFRGRPGADIDALIATIVAVGAIGHHLGDMIHSLDLNPVIAHPKGCVAVDALVARRG